MIVAWNIVTSTFVEKAFRLAMPDVDMLIQRKRAHDIKYAKELLEFIRKRLDEDHNGRISVEEFKRHMDDNEVRQFFAARDMDLKDADLFFRMLISLGEDQEEVDLQTFVAGCMKL